MCFDRLAMVFVSSFFLTGSCDFNTGRICPPFEGATARRGTHGKPTTRTHWAGGAEFDPRHGSGIDATASTKQWKRRWDIFTLERFVSNGSTERSSWSRTLEVVSATERPEGSVSGGQIKGSGSPALPFTEGRSRWSAPRGKQFRQGELLNLELVLHDGIMMNSELTQLTHVDTLALCEHLVPQTNLKKRN